MSEKITGRLNVVNAFIKLGTERQATSMSVRATAGWVKVCNAEFDGLWGGDTMIGTVTLQTDIRLVGMFELVEVED